LREYRWKLNPNKCVFGVPSGKLLGFIISHRGIEANPEKISAITNMKAPTCIKDVQKLTGCMAALNRFISKLGERGLPFFKLLKHQEKFTWTLEEDQVMRNQDATGRISKWAVELGALNINFKSRTAIKSQALVDFMVEWRENQLPTPTECPEHWVMYFDSSLTNSPEWRAAYSK
jgi:hypothetical protein